MPCACTREHRPPARIAPERGGHSALLTSQAAVCSWHRKLPFVKMQGPQLEQNTLSIRHPFEQRSQQGAQNGATPEKSCWRLCSRTPFQALAYALPGRCWAFSMQQCLSAARHPCCAAHATSPHPPAQPPSPTAHHVLLLFSANCTLPVGRRYQPQASANSAL